MATASFIPRSEINRVLKLGFDKIGKARVFAAMSRYNTLYMIMNAGSGHIGSSFSAMDIVSWLFLHEMRVAKPYAPKGFGDIYFSSKGHDAPGLYAALVGLGLLEEEKLHKLRRLGGLPGHPDVLETPYMQTNTGSLGMGISKAKGMVHAARLAGETTRLFVLTGDGELQEGQIWESLRSAVHWRMGEITVIVDHNKIQSDTWVKKVNDLGDLEGRFACSGWVVERCNGNDPAAIEQALARVAGIKDRPKVIIADTCKGYGVSFMSSASMPEDLRLYRFHSGAPSQEDYEKAAQELLAEVDKLVKGAGGDSVQVEACELSARKVPGKEKLVGAYARALLAEAEKHQNLVALDADLALDTGLIEFERRFPKRFVECGIAEQDMVSMASGMALKGLLPVVHSFACFLTPRPNEQIYNTSTEGTKVIYVGSLAGLIPAAPGHSHQSVRDIALLAHIPGMTLIEPCCEAETEQAVAHCVNEAPGACYLRLVTPPCDLPFSLPREYRLEPYRGTVLRDGKDVVVFGYGPILLAQAYLAAEELAKQHKLGVKVVNLPWLNRVDRDWLAETVRGFSRIVTLDNHYVIGGQGDFIASEVAALGLKTSWRLKKVGIEKLPACGQPDEVLAHHQLAAPELARQLLRLVEATT